MGRIFAPCFLKRRFQFLGRNFLGSLATAVILHCCVEGQPSARRRDHERRRAEGSQNKLWAEPVYYYTRVSWQTPYAVLAEAFLKETMPKLEALSYGKPGNVRIVFWFDNDIRFRRRVPELIRHICHPCSRGVHGSPLQYGPRNRPARRDSPERHQ
jgi:hypothetical protein